MGREREGEGNEGKGKEEGKGGEEKGRNGKEAGAPPPLQMTFMHDASGDTLTVRENAG